MNPTGPNPPPYRQPAPPPGVYRPHSGLSVASFVVGLIAFVAGIIPFAGFLGVVGVILGLVDRNRVDPPNAPQRHGMSTAGIVLGSLSTLGAIAWVVAVVWLATSVKAGSCPHLYAFDGEKYELDADLASGALYKGAEREDTDRLESLREVDGQYRVRLQNDLEEIDNVDSLSLLVADAPSDVEVLPTASGELVSMSGARAPLRVSTSPSIRRADPRESHTFEFARPAQIDSARAALVLRARNTRFAEEAFLKYMAKMGQGIRPMLEMASESKETCGCYRRYLDEEIERLGLPLWVSVSSQDGSVTTRHVVAPIGPATPRSQALRIDLPPGEGPVIVTIEATPRFWEIDRVELAHERAAPVVSVLRPKSAVGMAGEDVLERLTETDGRRLVIRQREHVDVRFDAPPPAPGRTRTVVARLRGYYDLDIGGQQGVDLSRIAAHQLGLVSLPTFAEGLGH
jgi:hypothetical protein